MPGGEARPRQPCSLVCLHPRWVGPLGHRRDTLMADVVPVEVHNLVRLTAEDVSGFVRLEDDRFPSMKNSRPAHPGQAQRPPQLHWQHHAPQLVGRSPHPGHFHDVHPPRRRACRPDFGVPRLLPSPGLPSNLGTGVSTMSVLGRLIATALWILAAAVPAARLHPALVGRHVPGRGGEPGLAVRPGAPAGRRGPRARRGHARLAAMAWNGCVGGGMS